MVTERGECRHSLRRHRARIESGLRGQRTATPKAVTVATGCVTIKKTKDVAR
jgi:KaiC/GvpD/RAD55 family RecA-like ATPase